MMISKVPLRVVVSNIMVVEKGDRVSMRVENFGYKRVEAPEDGIYLGPDYPILTYSELKSVVRDLKRLRRRRQDELEEEIERRVTVPIDVSTVNSHDGWSLK